MNKLMTLTLQTATDLPATDLPATGLPAINRTAFGRTATSRMVLFDRQSACTADSNSNDARIGTGDTG